MIENKDFFDLELTDQEMKQIASLDRKDGNNFDNRNPEVVKNICLNRYEY